MSFFSAIGNWFKSALSQILDFLKPAAAQLAANGGMILLEAASAAVAAVAADPSVLTDSDKRDAAGKLILADMQRKGIQASVSAINLAIETALASFKASK
jgi:hypothetical protein